MVCKRLAISTLSKVKPKYARISLFLEMKLNIIKRLEAGAESNFIALACNLTQSTISTDAENAAAVKKS